MTNVRLLLCVAALMLPLGSPCQSDNTARTGEQPVVRWHFAGRTALAQGTNANRLKLVDSLATTANLRLQIASNLSTVPRKFWAKELPATAPDGASLLRPLFDDLLSAESYGEVRGPSGALETVVAVQIAEDRARLWNTNLWQLMNAWQQGTPAAVARDGATGWEIKRPKEPRAIQVLRSGHWTIFAMGSEKLPLVSSLLQHIKSPQPAAEPAGQLLQLDADSAALGKWFALFTDLNLPPFSLTLTGRGENVRTEVKLRFPTPLAIHYLPWKIPTNMIGEPISSFTVARGVAPLINRLIDFDKFEIGKSPDQICMWGVTNDPCRAYLTFPRDDAVRDMPKLSLTVPRLIGKMIPEYMGYFLYLSNRNTLMWGSLPYIEPILMPITNSGTLFLHAGTFPLPPKQPAAPPELFAQLGSRTNLVYYDWETTPFRILHGNALYTFLDIIAQRRVQTDKSASKIWMLDMVRELNKDPMNPGQTVTEILQTGPNELTLTRKSHLGLTGFEIASLSAWIDSPGFPFRYELPPPMPVRRGTNAPPGTPPRKP